MAVAYGKVPTRWDLPKIQVSLCLPFLICERSMNSCAACRSVSPSLFLSYFPRSMPFSISLNRTPPYNPNPQRATPFNLLQLHNKDSPDTRLTNVLGCETFKFKEPISMPLTTESNCLASEVLMLS